MTEADVDYAVVAMAAGIARDIDRKLADELCQEIEDDLQRIQAEEAELAAQVKVNSQFISLSATAGLFPPSGTMYHFYQRPLVAGDMLKVTYTVVPDDMYDGMALARCFEVYEAGMRGESGAVLTDKQLAAAKAEWSRRLREKRMSSNPAVSRPQVVVDLED